MQPIYRTNGFVTREGNGRAKTNAYISGGSVGKDGKPLDIGMDIFHRGMCLPSDNKMTEKEQGIIIDIIKECFRQKDIMKNANALIVYLKHKGCRNYE